MADRSTGSTHTVPCTVCQRLRLASIVLPTAVGVPAMRAKTVPGRNALSERFGELGLVEFSFVFFRHVCYLFVWMLVLFCSWFGHGPNQNRSLSCQTAQLSFVGICGTVWRWLVCFSTHALSLTSAQLKHWPRLSETGFWAQKTTTLGLFWARIQERRTCRLRFGR